MSFYNNSAGIMIYFINALVEKDPDFTVSEAVSAGEEGLIGVLFERADLRSVDVSLLKATFDDDPGARTAVDDLYARWTNASDASSYALSVESNGWLWLSSISIDSFLVGPYGDQKALMQ